MKRSRRPGSQQNHRLPKPILAPFTEQRRNRRQQHTQEMHTNSKHHSDKTQRGLESSLIAPQRGNGNVDGFRRCQWVRPEGHFTLIFSILQGGDASHYLCACTLSGEYETHLARRERRGKRPEGAGTMREGREGRTRGEGQATRAKASRHRAHTLPS